MLTYFFTDTIGVALQVFDHIVDLTQLAWDADVLRAMGLALSTLDAVVRLTITRHGTVE